MLPIAYASAIVAAGLNASSSVVQRIATRKPNKDQLFSHRFFYEVIKSRLFIAGFGLQVAAFLAQATALSNGPLIVVEPLLTSDLVFLLLLIHWRLKIHIQLRDWMAVAAIIVGLSGMFYVFHPISGHLVYQPLPWIILTSVLAVIVLGLALGTRRITSPSSRAILSGIAAAASYALNAAFTKLTIQIVQQHGVVAALTNWPLYALIISGLTSVYLMLNAYGAGPLAVSQPIMEVFEPGIAVVIGIMIFGDSITTTISALAAGTFFVVILTIGVISLASSPKIHEAGKQGI